MREGEGMDQRAGGYLFIYLLSDDNFQPHNPQASQIMKFPF